jgi:hypothetical protein
MVYPAIVAVAATLFAVQVGRQYRSRRKTYQFVWAVALTMGALAALAFILFLSFDRNPFWFRVYYIFGALLMAAYLGLGSVFLLAPQRTAQLTALALIAASAAGAVVLLLAPLDTTSLHAANVEAGTGVVSGLPVVFVAVLNTFGAVAVAGGAVYSMYRVKTRGGPLRVMLAQSLIAAGTLLASIAGTAARIGGGGQWFWLLLALGFVVLFAGFVTISGGWSAIALRPRKPVVGGS